MAAKDRPTRPRPELEAKLREAKTVLETTDRRVLLLRRELRQAEDQTVRAKAFVDALAYALAPDASVVLTPGEAN